MSTRTVLVRVTADTAGFTGPMRMATTTADTFGAAATRGGRGVRTLTGAAAGARAGLTGVGEGATRAHTGLTRVSGAADDVSRGMRGMTGSARGVQGAFGRVASEGTRSFGAVRTAMSRAASMAGELGLILAGGAIFKGIEHLVETGNEYNDSMNKFSEVTRASGGDMKTAATQAQALGSDLKLPKASAAEAADAMVELAKAGLSARDSITAARGTIQLSSAARTDVGTAARIEGDALDQFGLKASDATMVADTLANVANNTSGELTDLSYALKYVGPTAHSMGISIQEATTAIGLLGKSGIIGETAGTALRSALVNMSKPTAMMKKGLKELDVQAYDSQGNFKGLEYVVGKLHDASEKLTTQQFTAAAAMAFGKPALSAVTALAHQGTQNFDAMATAIGRQGGAAALAAAESKGLGGAMRGLGKELSSTFLQVYLAVAPSLEGITRGLSGGVAKALPVLKRGIKTAEDLWDIYGPGVEDKLSRAAGGVESAAKGMVKPAEKAVADLVTLAVPLAATIGVNLAKGFHNVQDAAQPVVSGVKDIVRSISGAGGAVDVFDGRLSIAVQGLQKVVGEAGNLTGGLKPVGGLLGDVAHGFSQLPGPIQLSVLGMLALRPFRPQIQAMQSAVTGYGRSAVASFNGVRGAMQTQRVLASQAGVSLSRYGSAMAALEARSPGIQAMGTAFRGVTSTLPEAATSIQRVGNTLRGVTAAGAVGALNGMKAAGRGLLGVMGGPWGIAITGAFAIMDVFAQHQQAAKQSVEDFTGSIQKDSGALGENSRALAAQKLQAAGAFDTARQYGISQGTVESAALGNKDALEQVNTALQKNATYTAYSTRGEEELGRGHKALNGDAKKLLGTIGDTSGAVGKATQAYKNETAATKDAGKTAADATDPTTNLKNAIDVLGNSASSAEDKANALHTALQLLSGGELDQQAALSQLNGSIQDMNDAWTGTIDKSKGFGASLISSDGYLDTTKENAKKLSDQLTAVGGSAATAASSTFDFARKNGDSVPAAMRKAEGAMQSAYDAAVKGGEKLGIPAEKAQQLASQMGLIPSDLALTLDLKGYDQSTRDLLYVQGLAEHLPQGHSIKVQALTDDAVKELTALGIKVERIPGGRVMKITAPTAKAQAALDQLIGKKLLPKSVHVDADTATAISELNGVQSKVATTKGKTITVGALTGTAVKSLESVGYSVHKLSGKRLSITAPTGTPISNVGALQRAIDALHGKDVSVTTYHYSKFFNTTNPFLKKNAEGSITRYAEGGMNEQHVAQIAPAGSWRLWAEPETGGEAYIPLAPSKRGRSRAIADETVRMLGGKGVAWADGGITQFASGGFTYAPNTPLDTLGAGSAQDRYTDALQKLTDAVGKLKDATTKAEKAAAHKAINSADAALGLKAGTTTTAFNLKSYQKELSLAVTANSRWESDLSKIGKKAGGDIEDTLRGMGESGRSLVGALAQATTSQFNAIVANLKKLAPTAAATLADYTKQLGAANSAGSAFQSNLLKLASMGYGDLASQLSGQGDDTAQAVAAAAVKSTTAAKAANAAAKTNAALLSSDDLATATELLGFLKAHPGAGIADVIGDGLDWDTVSTLAPKIASQLKGLSAASTFVTQVRGQGIPMLHGGIAPDGADVHFAEKGTGGEAFIPLGAAHRARSTSLLSGVAGMLGYQLTPVGQASRSISTRDGGDHRVYNITMNGAKQTTSEQANDLVRRMAFSG